MRISEAQKGRGVLGMDLLHPLDGGHDLFIDLLRIMHNIDSDELDNVFINDDEWSAFRRDPFQWLIHNQGDRTKQIYRLATKRYRRLSDA